MAHTAAVRAGGDRERVGRAPDRGTWLDHAARIGLVAYGVVYLMIAWLAVQLALGKHPRQSASAKGALAALTDAPLGHVLVWAVAVGLFLLVVWRVLEAFSGHRGARGAAQVRKRLASLGKAIVYGVIGVSAVRIASGGGQSSTGPKTVTARLLDLPAGPWIVGFVGICIVGYGVGQLWWGCTDRFLKHLDVNGRTGDDGRAYTWFGRVGYVAKGVAFSIVGCLFGYAAITHEPQKSGGLDQALRKVLEQPFGPWLLLLTALGIGCYGLFCFAWARHLSR